MKRMFSSFFAFLMILNIVAFARSSSVTGEENIERVYIETGIVQIANNRIFLNVDETFIPITFLGQDEKGSYVTIDSDAVNMVMCSRCGKSYDSDNQSRNCPHGWMLNRPNR